MHPSTGMWSEQKLGTPIRARHIQMYPACFGLANRAPELAVYVSTGSLLLIAHLSAAMMTGSADRFCALE